jgi:hypothetical protein
VSRRPSALGRDLLAVLEVSEGRRRRRKRDTIPDAIGLGIKRRLLEAAVVDDPEPEAFESWLLERCPVGAFDTWLAEGAPSDDPITPAGPDG